MIFGSELCAMGPNAFAEIDSADDFAGGKVDHPKERAVSARMADAGIAIDGDKRSFAIGRGDHFVAGDSVFRDGGDLFSGDWIDEAKGLIAFIGDQQKASAALGGRQKHGRAKVEDQIGEINSEAHGRRID